MTGVWLLARGGPGRGQHAQKQGPGPAGTGAVGLKVHPRSVKRALQRRRKGASGEGMKIMAAATDLAQGYEALRAQAVGEIPTMTPLGLAVLMRGGLPSWMRACPPASQPCAARTSRGSRPDPVPYTHPWLRTKEDTDVMSASSPLPEPAPLSLEERCAGLDDAIER